MVYSSRIFETILENIQTIPDNSIGILLVNSKQFWNFLEGFGKFWALMLMKFSTVLEYS